MGRYFGGGDVQMRSFGAEYCIWTLVNGVHRCEIFDWRDIVNVRCHIQEQDKTPLQHAKLTDLTKLRSAR